MDMTQTKGFCKWAAVFHSIFVMACFSHVNISDEMQANVNSRLIGQDLWLKQSLYAGPFYDDDRYQLVHPRRFEELTYLKTLDGDFILPPPSDEIIPVGTRVHIQKIEWPTGMNILKRPIFTPRHWAWVYMQIARDRGPVTLNRDRTYVFILPTDTNDDATMKAWIDGIFAHQDTNEWLLSNDKAVRDGIIEKRPVIGMNYDALLAAMGEPDQIRRELVKHDTTSATKEIAFYGPTVIILEDGKVAKVEQAK